MRSQRPPPKLGSKILLLKIPHTLISRHEEIKAALTWKFLPCQPMFIFREDAMQLLGRSHEESYTAVNSTSLGKDKPEEIPMTATWRKHYESN